MTATSSPRKCLILAAGRGSRLADWGTAKPRLRLLGVPLIERVILAAQRAGLSEFTVVTGYDALRLQKFLDELAVRRGVCIDTVLNEEWKTAGNGRSVLAAKDILREPFVLLMADHLVEPSLLVGLQSEPLDEGTVRLAVDRRQLLAEAYDLEQSVVELLGRSEVADRDEDVVDSDDLFGHCNAFVALSNGSAFSCAEGADR